MLVRALVILALVWQPLSMLSWAQTGGVPSHCRVSACCVPVERTGCCGERLAETVCQHTGGECTCVAPVDDKAPRPEAPLTNRDRETLQATPTTDLSFVGWGIEPSDQKARAISAAFLTAGKSHNRVQAFLGVWRM